MSNPRFDIEGYTLQFDPRVVSLLRRCVAAALPLDSVYVVGGAVRDALLGRPSEDVDLVVRHVTTYGNDPAGLVFGQALASVRVGRIVSEHEFGTIQLDVPDTGRVDIATARDEIYPKPGALPNVQFVSDVSRDLARRDITINALAVPALAVLSGAHLTDIIDNYTGKSDLTAGLIRVLHDRSFIDDPTRILRVIRYAGAIEGFEIEPGTLQLLRDAVRGGALSTVSPQRISAELTIACSSPATVPITHLLSELGVLSALGLPDGAGRDLESRMAVAGTESLLAPDRLLLSLATVAGAFSDEADAKEWLAGLTISSQVVAQATSLLHVISAAHELAERGTPEARDVLLQHALDASPTAVRLANIIEPLPEFNTVLTNRASFTPQMSGEDLQQMGLADGPRTGEVLAALAKGRRAGTITTLADEFQIAREMISQAPAASDDSA